MVKDIDKNIKIAIMGCVVNGPGEAKDADFGVAGGLNECIFFRKGVLEKKIKSLPARWLSVSILSGDTSLTDEVTRFLNFNCISFGV